MVDPQSSQEAEHISMGKPRRSSARWTVEWRGEGRSDGELAMLVAVPATSNPAGSGSAALRRSPTEAGVLAGGRVTAGSPVDVTPIDEVLVARRRTGILEVAAVPEGGGALVVDWLRLGLLDRHSGFRDFADLGLCRTLGFERLLVVDRDPPTTVGVLGGLGSHLERESIAALFVDREFERLEEVSVALVTQERSDEIQTSLPGTRALEQVAPDSDLDSSWRIRVTVDVELVLPRLERQVGDKAENALVDDG